MSAGRRPAWLLTSALLMLALAASPGRACVGDHDGDRRVTVDELIRCVAGILGVAPPAAACRDIDSLISAVNNALLGCPPAQTPRPTPTASPSVTYTGAPTLTPTAPAPSATPTPTTTRERTRTPTSCVSEAPDISTAVADAADPFRWRFAGRSRVLLNSRGSVYAGLNCSGTTLAIHIPYPGSQPFEFEAELAHPGTNLVYACTAPSVCGTPYCRQRRVVCGESSCTDEGNLSPILAQDRCSSHGIDLRPAGLTAFGVYSSICGRPLAYLSVCVDNIGDAAAGSFVVSVEPGSDRFEIGSLGAQERSCADRPFTGWEQSGYHTFTVQVDVAGTVEELDETNNISVTQVLRPTIPLTCSPTVTPTPTSTRTAAAEGCRAATADCTLAESAVQVGVLVGAAIADPNAPHTRAAVPRHFNSITAENAMKWGSLAPMVGRYDFTAADAIADFAARTGTRLRGHTLLWRDQQPADLAAQIAAATDPAQRMRELVTEHFETVVTRYRGRVAMWDVVNEPLTTLGAELDRNVFYRTLGPGYIAEAFRLAHRLDPDAALCLNEFLMTYSDTDPRTLALLALVRGLLADGVPLHAVGLQAHFHGLNLPPQRAPLERVVRMFAELGVGVELTELDVSIRYFDDDVDPLARQAAAFGDVVAACMAVPRCTAITVWGIDDGRTWLDYFPPFDLLAPHAPLLFDAALMPKPAYFAVRDAIALRPQP